MAPFRGLPAASSFETTVSILALLAGVVGTVFTVLAYYRSKTSGSPSAGRRPSWSLLGAGLAVLLAGAGLTLLQLFQGARFPPLHTYPRTIGLALVGVAVCVLAMARARDPDERRRSSDRTMFARHLKGQIELFNSRAAWEDRHYAELQAAVEAADPPGFLGSLVQQLRPNRGVRQVKSLTQALASSSAPMILLEGDPGSGKSVALRHVALDMATRAERARRRRRVLPVYVNLKGLRPGPGEEVDADLVSRFVQDMLKKGNAPGIEEYIDAEFGRGLRAGTWLFLFDSFDEIPDILTATEVDETVLAYAEALFSFIHGLHRSRGVIASRDFRGPSLPFQARFRIRDLSEEQKRRLIHLALASKPAAEETLLGELPMATRDIQELSGNPLFLRLLCDHVGAGQPFPTIRHDVFATYVDTRLVKQDQTRTAGLRRPLTEVRTIAEQLAFCMTAEGLGLDPPRVALRAAMARNEFPSGPEVFEVMDLLQAMRLAVTPDPHESGDSPPFQFVHRRFQEYFATCVVLRDLDHTTPVDRVPPEELLTGDLWREAAVAIFQTQPPEKMAPLLEAADRLLEEALAGAPEIPPDAAAVIGQDTDAANGAGTFTWPPRALHILSVLDAGFSAGRGSLGPAIRDKAGRLLAAAASRGQIYDRRWALDAAGTAPREVFVWLVRRALQSPFAWLREAGYRQIGRLGQVPDDIVVEIRQMLLSMAAAGDLRRQRLAVEVQLRRLKREQEFVDMQRLLLAAPLVDLGLHLGLLAGLAVWASRRGFLTPYLLVLLALALLSVRLTRLLPGLPVHAWRHPATLLDQFARRLGPEGVVCGSVRALLGLMIIVLVLDDPWWQVGLWLLVVLYVLTWSIGAVWAAALGRPVSVGRWPTVHLQLVVDALRRRAREGKLGADIAGWLIGGLMVAVGLALFVFYDSYRDLLPGWLTDAISAVASPPTWVWVVLGVFFGLVWLAMLVSAVLGAGRQLRALVVRTGDLLWARKWLAGHAGKVAGPDLLAAFDKLRTGSEVVRLVRSIRIQQRYDEGDASRAILSDLVKVGELDAVAVSTEPVPGSAIAERAGLPEGEVRAWLERQDAAGRQRRVWSEPACVEELGRIMDQLVRADAGRRVSLAGPADRDRTASGGVKS